MGNCRKVKIGTCVKEGWLRLSFRVRFRVSCQSVLTDGATPLLVPSSHMGLLTILPMMLEIQLLMSRLLPVDWKPSLAKSAQGTIGTFSLQKTSTRCVKWKFPSVQLNL